MPRIERAARKDCARVGEFRVKDGWHPVQLKDICTSVEYGYTASAKSESVGPKFLRITDIQNDFVNWDSVPYCKIPDKEKRKYKLSVGDICIARTGNSTGQSIAIRDDVDAVFASYLIRFRINRDVADPFFVDLVLRSSLFKDYVRNIVGGSAQPNANAKQLGGFRFSLPPLPIQHRIASILGALDDKIECNRRINQTLEQMAQALYKHWFVDFAPFRGEGMMETELGEIPKGWQVGTFGDIVSIVARVINPQKFLDEDFLHLSIPAFDNERRASIERGRKILSGKLLIDTNCVLVSKLNPRIYRVWTIFPKGQLRAISSTEFIPYVPKQGVAWAFLNSHVRSKNFVQDFESHATGTTGSRQRVRPERTLSFPCAIPPNGVLQEFEGITGTYWKQMDGNLGENESLILTRDYLLPKLMSGEIEIKSVEKEIQDMV